MKALSTLPGKLLPRTLLPHEVFGIVCTPRTDGDSSTFGLWRSGMAKPRPFLFRKRRLKILSRLSGMLVFSQSVCRWPKTQNLRLERGFGVVRELCALAARRVGHDDGLNTPSSERCQLQIPSG
jgi:hypothetical protein